MTKPKILVVEDERVVAADIEDALRKLGYTVAGAAASGVSAIRRAVETEPDLVLMDIKLKGQMDGIDAAGEMHDRLGIPVVFLTAYADAEILNRAKKSSPSGYVLKPFDERALRSAVEIALYRHPRERSLAESERRFVTALRGFGDAVILTESSGNISFMNRTAERLTGWSNSGAMGRRITDVLVVLDAKRGSLRPDPVRRVLQEGVVLGMGDDCTLAGRYGSEVWIEGTVTPLRDDDREVVGAAVVFRAVSRMRDSELEKPVPAAGWRFETLGRLAGGFAGASESALDAIRESAERAASLAGGDARLRNELNNLVETAHHARVAAEQMQLLAQRREPRPRTIPVNESVQAALGLLPHVAGPKISIETALAEKAGHVNADPLQIHQILLDLTMLSSQRMPCGGKITIESDSVELLPEYARTHTRLKPGRYAVVSLSYAGAVMMPGADDPEADCPAVCETIRSLGGDILIRSEPGRLTIHEIYLPRIVPDTPTARSTEQPVERAPKALNDLLLGALFPVHQADDAEDIEAGSAAGLDRHGRGAARRGDILDHNHINRSSIPQALDLPLHAVLLGFLPTMNAFTTWPVSRLSRAIAPTTGSAPIVRPPTAAGFQPCSSIFARNSRPISGIASARSVVTRASTYTVLFFPLASVNSLPRRTENFFRIAFSASRSFSSDIL